jgi:hypothetical protein
MSEEYVRKADPLLAIQLTEDNIENVKSWLDKFSIQYSYDPIKSGGELIVYSDDGPDMVYVGSWILLGFKRPYVYSDESFNERFERRDLNQ